MQAHTNSHSLLPHTHNKEEAFTGSSSHTICLYTK